MIGVRVPIKPRSSEEAAHKDALGHLFMMTEERVRALALQLHIPGSSTKDVEKLRKEIRDYKKG